MSNDAIARVLDVRQLRGKTLAQHARIKKITDELWVVPSATHKGTYVVDTKASTCTCSDFEENRKKCKHLWALAYARHEVVEADESIVEQRTLSITYRQDWRAYNAAQTSEKEHVETLLRSLCAAVTTPSPPSKRGRPRLPLADVLFSAVMKTYVGLSGRRATTDLRASEAKGHLAKAPHYNSVFAYLDNPEITPVLTNLVHQAAVPLVAIEGDKHFSADSTGFATATYYRWFDHKWGKEKSEQKWVKAHAMIGAKTNVVTAVRVVHTNEADGPQLPGLLDTTAQTFRMSEVSADKAYLSNVNLAAIERLGAVPFIPFKSNSVGDGPDATDAWKRMWAMFTLEPERFSQHYHQRSNAETAFSMVKKKFGPSVRAKSEHGQTNEVLCKFLCHNLCVLVQSFHEFGVDPTFGAQRPRVAL